MERVYNFAPGPAMLPQQALETAAAEMLSYQGTGMSVMEMSHRSKPFQNIIETAEADLRELLGIPEKVMPLAIIPVGHPAEDPAPKDKWKPENVSYNEFGK